MFSASLALSFLLLIGGGVVMPYEHRIATGLYILSPFPMIAWKVVHSCRTPSDEIKRSPAVVEDPVAPTPDEPSAV